jgi:outer membrane protein OmpA-like peptidoglycan-associated protein
MKKFVAAILILALVTGTWGCASMSKKEKGAVIGAGAGAAAGAAIGSQAGNTLLGALIGAAVGGAAGAYIGNYMDNQAEEIERDIEGATVERVEEGIKITFDSGILFNVDEAALQVEAQSNLAKLATILNKYDDTKILIEGHTDATGSEEYNLDLSVERAESVSNYLALQDVNSVRFTVHGYGELQPVADNESVEGRQANRRVDLAIMANDELKKVAEDKVDEASG